MKRGILALSVGVVVSAALGGIATHAHHAISGVYDSSRPATIHGVVTQFRFVNPHPFVMMTVQSAAGAAQSWTLEMDNRSELADIGVTNDTLKPGDRIVVTGSLGRSQTQSLYIRKLERPADGFTYEQVGTRPRITPGRRGG